MLIGWVALNITQFSFCFNVLSMLPRLPPQQAGAYLQDLWLGKPSNNLASVTWQSVFPTGVAAPVARSHHTLTDCNGNLWLFGGQTAAGASNELFYLQYHPNNAAAAAWEWAQVAATGSTASWYVDSCFAK